MKRKLILFYCSIVGLSAMSLTSCVDIDLSAVSKDVQIKESLVMPIGEANLNIGDILTKLSLPDQIKMNADTINFVTELNSQYQFLNVNLLANPVTTNLPFTIAPIPQVPANTEIPITGTVLDVNLGLDPNSTTQRVDKIEITKFVFGINISRSNLFVFGTTSPISESDLRIVMIFPKFYKSNTTTPIDPVEVPINQFDQLSNVTLNDFYMDTKGLTGTPILVKLYSGNRDITVAASATLNLSVVISEIQNIVAYGKFQLNSTAPTTLKLPLDMLSAIPAGLNFANPKATITLTSDIGTYLQFNIESIKAYSKDRSIIKQGLFKNGSQSTTEVIDVKPMTPKDKAVTKQLHTLDRNYGSLDQLFDRSLDTLEYKFSLTTADALNDTSATPSFITPGMSMKANIKIEVPLYFKSGSNYTLTDTLSNINIPFGNVDNAILVLKVTNALPVKATFSMKFLDASNNVITSSLNTSTYVINSGEVNSFGLVTAETVSPINIELTQTQANEIKDAKSMIYSLVLAGKTDNDPIQITKNNYIKVKLGAYLKGKYSTTLGSNN